MAGVSEEFPRGMVSARTAGLLRVDQITEGLISQDKDLGTRRSTVSGGMTASGLLFGKSTLQ